MAANFIHSDFRWFMASNTFFITGPQQSIVTLRAGCRVTGITRSGICSIWKSISASCMAIRSNMAWSVIQTNGGIPPGTSFGMTGFFYGPINRWERQASPDRDRTLPQAPRRQGRRALSFRLGLGLKYSFADPNR